MTVSGIYIMQRSTFFGFDPKVRQVFIFLFENDDKKLSLFIEYTDEESLKAAKQDIGLYGFFWESGTSIEDIISLFDRKPSIEEQVLLRRYERT